MRDTLRFSIFGDVAGGAAIVWHEKNMCTVWSKKQDAGRKVH